jgi:hypothetical protein
VEFIKQVRPCTGASDALANPFYAIKTDVSETELLCGLPMELRAEFYLIALVQ